MKIHKLLLPVLFASLSSIAGAKDFRVAENQAADFPTVLALKYMGEKIAKASNGKYNLKVYPNSTLGSGKDTTEQVKIGALDMARVSTSEFHGIIPESLVPSFPFIFRDNDHYRKVIYGPVGGEILKAFEKHGYVALMMMEGGARSIYAKKPVRNLEDIKGMKIRVQPSDLWISLVQAMGATPTPIPYAEVYTALKTGLVDAAENNYPSFESTKHFEAAPIYSETQHVMSPDILIFSKKIWDKLNADEQKMIRQAVKETIPHYMKLWDATDEAAKKAVKEAGVTIIPASEIDHQAFVNVMKPVWDKFSATPELKSLVQKVVDTK